MKKIFGLRLKLAVAVVLLSLAVLSMAKVVGADNWSWTSGMPVVESINNAGPESTWNEPCDPAKQVKMGGSMTYRSITTNCIVGEQSYAKLYHYNGGSLAIKFNGDSSAYPIEGMGCNSSCNYLPSRDMLVRIDYNNDVHAGRIVMYQDFIKKLHLKNQLVLNQRYYEFDQAQPDKIIGDFYGQPGYFGYARGLSKSPNDKWLLVEHQDGLFRIDMDSLQLFKFSDFALNYTYARGGPSYEIANDGQHVAVVGDNVESSIYELVNNCGRIMPTAPTEEQMGEALSTKCPQLKLDGTTANETYMSQMTKAYSTKYSDDGGEISFYAVSADSSVTPKYVTLRAAGYNVSRLDYLALGDSYSSGEGDTETDFNGKRYYRDYTDIKGSSTTPEERCHISTRSYPYLLAASMSLKIDDPKQWDSVACGGATGWDVKAQGSAAYLGEGDRLKGFNSAGLKVQALNEFIPGREKQIEFVKKYKPKVITLTLGGNDIGFGDKLRPCILGFDTCSYASTDKGELKKTILDQYENLKSLYNEIYSASGHQAKIYVIGYPIFINEDTYAQCLMNVGSLGSDERKMIYSSTILINNVIRQAAQAAGAKYVDIEDSLSGHRLCDHDTKYVTGATDPLGWKGGYQQESFHPNAKGHQAIESSIISKVGNLKTYNTCPLVLISNNCPDNSATKDTIPIPDYFKDVNSDTNTQYKQITSFEQVVGTEIKIVSSLYSFATSSDVAIAIHSDPVGLGSYVTGEDGSLDVGIAIPLSVPAGMHTLILSGKTMSGDPIEYEQTILVKSSDPNDVDADGIPDTEDECSFIPASGQDVDKDSIDDACDPEINEAVSPTPTPNPIPTPPSTTTPQQGLQSFVNAVVSMIAQTIKAVTKAINGFISFLQKILLGLK